MQLFSLRGLTNREHTLKLFSMNSLRVSQAKQQKGFAIKLNSCIIKLYFQKEEIMKKGKLTISDNNKEGVIVLVGDIAWLEMRALAYRSKGYNCVIEWVQS
jgi:hypothetical protein